MRKSVLSTSLLGLVILGCATAKRVPSSLGEESSGFGYVPLDGLAVFQYPESVSCTTHDTQGNLVKLPYRPTLQALPDLSVRFAVANFAGNGSLSFGPAKITSQNGTYRAVLDYVNVDDIPVEFFMRKYVRTKSGIVIRRMVSQVAPDETVESYEVKSRGQGSATDTAYFQSPGNQFDQVTVPIYVGIGMRLSADIRANKEGLALTSLASIGAQAEANDLSGTLTVQTLGVTGKSIATALPLPSKLDQTTVENGVLAIGSTRAFIYGGANQVGPPSGNQTNDVTITPRVVGLYSPVGTDPRLISEIYSELARDTPWWLRYCGPSM